MCYSCWVKYGKPSIINDRTRQAAQLVEKVYEFSSVGGNLHIIVDDFNIDDRHIASCALYLLEDKESRADKFEAELKCLKLFHEMSIEERASALAIYDGWIDDD